MLHLNVNIKPHGPVLLVQKRPTQSEKKSQVLQVNMKKCNINVMQPVIHDSYLGRCCQDVWSTCECYRGSKGLEDQSRVHDITRTTWVRLVLISSLRRHLASMSGHYTVTASAGASAAQSSAGHLGYKKKKEKTNQKRPDMEMFRCLFPLEIHKSFRRVNSSLFTPVGRW